MVRWCEMKGFSICLKDTQANPIREKRVFFNLGAALAKTQLHQQIPPTFGTKLQSKIMLSLSTRNARSSFRVCSEKDETSSRADAHGVGAQLEIEVHIIEGLRFRAVRFASCAVRKKMAHAQRRCPRDLSSALPPLLLITAMRPSLQRA